MSAGATIAVACHIVLLNAEAARLGASSCAHVSRFDPDGAVMFFTFERDGAAADDTTCAALERAAEAAGAWLLGARAVKLDAYLRALRDTLDPQPRDVELTLPGRS